MGHKVDTALDGEQAVQRLEEKEYDLEGSLVKGINCVLLKVTFLTLILNDRTI